ncbi:MAG: XTP/dITP diphosphatase [bacterium]
MRSVVLVIGTHNEKKGREIAAILASPGLELKTLADFPDAPEPVEDGETFEENATKKATELADALGRAVVADDSGLEVPALGGEPGVHSARYAGEHGNDPRNIERLLRELDGLPAEERTARFRTVAALAVPGRLLARTTGSLEGVIADAPRGTGGFGYDPVFYLPELGRTCAELSPAEKNRVSHRGRAFRKLKERLPERLGAGRAGSDE